MLYSCWDSTVELTGGLTFTLMWLWSSVGWISLALSWSFPSTARPKFWIRSVSSSVAGTPPPWWWWWLWSPWCSPPLQSMPVKHNNNYLLFVVGISLNTGNYIFFQSGGCGVVISQNTMDQCINIIHRVLEIKSVLYFFYNPDRE